MSQHATKTVRRYDLDWLRVIVFGLLIPFHVAVGFVPWDVYPYENAQPAGQLDRDDPELHESVALACFCFSFRGWGPPSR